MVETFEAIAVSAIALLPGALYVWAFEREVGNWGVGLSDRVLRFFGTSAIFHVLLLPLTYWVWTTFIRTGDVATGEPLPLYLWLLAIGYIAVPFATGAIVGRGTREGWEWVATFTGPNPAPRAWDHFFASRPDGWVRLRLNRGVWIGGVYATSREGLPSYAAGYPDAQDLFLAEAVEVDPETGAFVLRDGRPIFRGVSILIRWDEVELLEFSDSTESEDPSD